MKGGELAEQLDEGPLAEGVCETGVHGKGRVLGGEEGDPSLRNLQEGGGEKEKEKVNEESGEDERRLLREESDGSPKRVSGRICSAQK